MSNMTAGVYFSHNGSWRGCVASKQACQVLCGYRATKIYLSIYLYIYITTCASNFHKSGVYFSQGGTIASCLSLFFSAVPFGSAITLVQNKSFIFPPKKFAPKGSYLCSPTAPGEVFMVRRWAERYDAPCLHFFNVPHTAPDSARRPQAGPDSARRPQAAPDGPKQRPAAPGGPTAPDGPRRPQMAPDSARRLRRPHTAPHGPRWRHGPRRRGPQTAPDGPRRPQAAPDGPRRPQAAPDARFPMRLRDRMRPVPVFPKTRPRPGQDPVQDPLVFSNDPSVLDFKE